jgi:hypothetical protein
MAIVFDPESQQYIDDQTGEVVANPYLYAGSQTPFIPGPGQDYGQAVFPGDFNKYGGMEPLEGADVRNQFGQANDLMKLFKDPMWRMYTDTYMPGANTFDWMSAAGQPTYGNAVVGRGGGGGGGGLGAGGGAGGAVGTPMLSGNYSPDDPATAPLFGIQQAVLSGQQTPQIMLGLLGTSETDPDKLNFLKDAADQMVKEFNSAQQGLPQTAMQKYLEGIGAADVRLPYDETNLPGDVDMSGLNATLDKYGQQYGQQYDEANRYLANHPAPMGLRGQQAGFTLNEPAGAGGAYAGQDRTFTGDNGSLLRALGIGIPSPTGQQVEAGLSLIGIKNPLKRPSGVTVNRSYPLSKEGKAVPYEQAAGEYDQMSRQFATADTMRQRLVNSAAQYRAIKARQLAQQGRTPARDQFDAMIRMARQSGIGV